MYSWNYFVRNAIVKEIDSMPSGIFRVQEVSYVPVHLPNMWRPELFSI